MTMAVLMRLVVMRVVALGVTVIAFVAMSVVMIVLRVIVLMFHRVQIPLMLECLHAPQPGEQNACP